MSAGYQFLSPFEPPCYDYSSLESRSESAINSELRSSSCIGILLNNQQSHQVYLSVDEPFTNRIQKDILGDISDPSVEDWLTSIAKKAMEVALEGIGSAQMSLVITGDDTIYSLNAQFRGLDEVTDVLSFSTKHGGHWEGEGNTPKDVTEFDFVMPPGEPFPLGEVIVSYPQAQRQVEERGGRLEHELALLVVHGVLHLTGHDHLEPNDTELMQSRERAALEKLNISA